MEMKAWTGVKGEENEEILRKGKVFVVFETLKNNNKVVVAEPFSPEYHRYESHNESFLWMIARNKEEAKKNFDAAQDEWRDKNDKGWTR